MNIALESGKIPEQAAVTEATPAQNVQTQLNSESTVFAAIYAISEAEPRAVLDPVEIERALAPIREVRFDVQRRLVALGYTLRHVDGVWGSATRKAIGQWQLAKGLPPTTFLDEYQIDLLRKQVALYQEGARHRAKTVRSRGPRLRKIGKKCGQKATQAISHAETKNTEQW